MADINEMPSKATRRLIKGANNVADVLDRAVDSFGVTVRAVVEQFGREIDPLNLPDDEYDAVVESSGLGRLLENADSMAERLADLAAV